MNRLIALCYFVLSLYGCDIGGSTLVHRTQVGGTDTLYIEGGAQPGVARFDCLRSASGRCYYTLFRRECASPSSARAPGSPTDPATGSAGSPGERSERCRSAPVERFAIANGGSRQIAGLPGFRACVSANDETPGPDCRVPAPIAAR